MNGLSVSVIINTYNRAQHLRRLLAGMGQLQRVDFEVVVVNGPSTDDTTAVLAAYQGRIKVIDCPTRNLSQSRNLGIAAAAGDSVVFIDDDALPADAEWLKRYVDAFAADEGEQIGAAGGPTWHRDTTGYEFRGGITSDYGRQVFDQTQLQQTLVDEQRWFRGVHGCNCAFRRAALIAVGGFDEFYTYYLDETDVCVRIARAGFKTAYLANNHVRHYSASSERRLSKYDRNWQVITRSDTYFGLKNGADAAPIRLAKTLAAAPRKHYVREINSYLSHGEISPMRWLRMIWQWGSGLTSGLRAGAMQRRQYGNFTYEPPSFMPFATPVPERRLRIALLSQATPLQAGYGGVARYTFDLALGLHERGHEIAIICKDEQPVHHYSLGFVIHGVAAGESVVRMTTKTILNRNVSYSLAVTRKLAALYEQNIVFDVVHGSNWDAEALATIRADVYPTVLMLVSSLAQVVQTEKWELTSDLRACIDLDRWQIEHADSVCVPSQGVLGSYRTLMGLDTQALKQLTVTPLGIVPQVIMAEPPSNQRHQLLFVGRCERRKGIHNLLAVVPDLLTLHGDWECHIVGNDQLPSPEGMTYKELFYKRHANALWLNRVTFHGTVSEAALQVFYQVCSLFVAPSLFESFGLIYHEAMQYAKPVVGCRTGGVPEVVEDGVEGLLVAPDQPIELFQALRRLMGDRALRERMGLAGQHRVMQHMNYRTMAVAMERVYQQTIATNGAERQAHRRQLWLRDLPLFPPSDQLVLVGEWGVREATPGHTYLVGAPEAVISFRASGHTRVRLLCLRHAWSGVIEVGYDQEVLQYIDLFKEDGLDLAYVVELVVPGSAERQCTLYLRVHPVRNPQSHAAEVWLQQIGVGETSPMTADAAINNIV